MKNVFMHEHETKKALADFIIKTGRLSMDVKCKEFEQAFAKKQGSKHAILFNSGGSANLAMIQAAKNLGLLKDGDLVGFSALTWSTNVMPIIQLGMNPVAIDCDTTTLNSMSTQLLSTLKEHDMRAFFITNALGFAGDLAEIKKMCTERDILLLEDNCESLGTELPEGKTGNFGLVSSFSFYVAHHMSTIEGGMVCTDNDNFAKMLRIVRANGWDRNLEPHQQKKLREEHNVESEFHSKYLFYDLGFNLRPTEITGFLGLCQLKSLDEGLRKREENHIRLEKVLLKNPDFIALDRSHVKTFSPFAFVIICKTPKLRKKYLKRFMDAEVEVRPVIAGNMQRQPFYKKYAHKIVALPGADLLHNNGFYCGNYPELTDEDLETISNCLRKD
ncbi:DegT/DnrJ/EryC1/StrS aminotransferase [Candidatus Campbellbacteria bacterium CG10_big_fil_rev_8_21_14_0_10_35_52]|uniref:DegT/DnrJ/EryC1/StrS aminotransferase n=1 Tax=Candidatus Campbellbacteria bacterium CG10_big_fil_rev_8_21_14_0_10_35_52 TaxID=1974527 RepID=A0A2M6WVT0_9BACT|nr:MAG: DegT/DnrJ/EryC1/StrS aminotransferase [Candidatus Campbellbacteria bacterium CG10_big_fil_rev_8_21_14_0_10_35_52]